MSGGRGDVVVCGEWGSRDRTERETEDLVRTLKVNWS